MASYNQYHIFTKSMMVIKGAQKVSEHFIIQILACNARKHYPSSHLTPTQSVSTYRELCHEGEEDVTK
jgi:hypothetical protein